jgi:hypothetical protein
MRKLMIGIGLTALLISGVTVPAAAAEPSNVGILRTVAIGGKRVPTSGFFIPPRIAGDADFNGNGPEILTSARLFGIGTRTLRVQLLMHATETRSDFTEVEGLSSMQTIFEASQGECVVSVRVFGDLVAPYDEINYRDSDITRDDFDSQVTNSFVHRWYIVGDTSGPEAGTETGAIIDTRGMTADVQPC